MTQRTALIPGIKSAKARILTLTTMRPALPISLAAALLAAEGTTTYSLQPGSDTQMNLYVEKTGVLSGKKHNFTFDRFNGVADMSKPSVRLEIEAASIRCLDDWVSEKDRRKILKVASDDMLAVNRFPSIRFESQEVVPKEDARFDIRGFLTIRDKSRLVAFTAKRLDSSRFSGEVKIRLSDFGLSPPSAALGLIGTKDEMRFAFQIGLRGMQ